MTRCVVLMASQIISPVCVGLAKVLASQLISQTDVAEVPHNNDTRVKHGLLVL